MPTRPSASGSSSSTARERVSWRRIVRNVPAIYARGYLGRTHGGRDGAEHPARRRRRGAAREPQAVLRARGPSHHRGARRPRRARARGRRAVRHRAARRRPRAAALRARRRAPAARASRGGADHHADRARQRGRRRPGPGGRRRRLRHEAVRARRAAQPDPRRPAPRARARRRGHGEGRAGRHRPADAAGHRRRRPGAPDVQRVRAAELPHGAPGQALHAPGAPARDLGRQRLSRPARDRRPHPPPAREARGAPGAAAAHPHRPRRWLPLPRAMRRGRPLGLRLRLLAAMVAVAAVTLLAAALALLPSLQDQLRAQNQDVLQKQTLDAIGLIERRVAPVNLGSRPAGSPTIVPRPSLAALQDAVFELSNRFDGRVAVTDLTPVVLYDTDNGVALPRASMFRAIVDDVSVTTEADGVVTMVVPLHRGGRQDGLLVTQKRLTDVAAAVDRVRQAFVTAALVGFAAAVVLASGLAATLARRLQRLRQAAVRITADGSDAPPPPVDA